MRSSVLLLAFAFCACSSAPPADDPLADFHTVLAPPLRILGDESPRTVERRAALLTATAQQMAEELFDEAPAPDLDVWLLRDAASTAENTRRLFGHDPDPPEGFYSVADHAVVVDVSRGDRAPVHYLVHAYVYANVPGCPVWFDEGLATLYEGLEAPWTASQPSPSLRDLTGLDQAGFHDRNAPVHRRAAREICALLQHDGKLRAYIQRLRANLASDPTGYETLLDALDHEDEQGLQEAWDRWLRDRPEEE